jgi:hypothetical protein
MTRTDTTKQATIVNTSAVPSVLGNGSILPAGESAKKVDMSIQHNRDLFFDGHLTVVDGFTPRTRHLASEETEPAAAQEGTEKA